AYARGDSVLLVRMALLGRFIEMPQRLFLSRKHADQSMQTLPSNIKSGKSVFSRILGTGPLPPPEWWDASRKGKVNFPEWKLVKEYFVSIGMMKKQLRFADRLHCHGVMVMWVVRNTHKLTRDVIYAIERVIRGWTNAAID